MKSAPACLPGTGSISRRISQDEFPTQIMTRINSRESMPVTLLSHGNEVCV